jgi:hypothetical protein
VNTERIQDERTRECQHLLADSRPNGSQALKRTRHQLSQWLDRNSVPHAIQRFRLRPYFTEVGGMWLIGSQLLLAAAVWLRWGWPALVIATISLLVMVLETAGIPLLSRLITDVGENIIIEIEPASEIEQEIVLSAHYDSKTELFNDRQRYFFMSKLPLAMMLAVTAGVLGLIDGVLQNSAESYANIPYYLGIALTLPQLGLFLPLGVNFTFGRFAPPSQGAVDNGTACAVLLSVAETLASGQLLPQRIKVTIALFCGEEVAVFEILVPVKSLN